MRLSVYNLQIMEQTNLQFYIHLIILLIVWNFFLVAAAYTGSFIPLLVALVITLIYKLAQKFIK